MKALGVEKNPDPLPGSLDVLQCKNGLDTIVEDYKTVPGWDNPYIQNHVVQPLQGALAVQDVELAYELPDAYNYEKIVLTLDRFSLGNYDGIKVMNQQIINGNAEGVGNIDQSGNAGVFCAFFNFGQKFTTAIDFRG